MKKIILTLIIILTFSNLHSQSTFDFQRAWSTYFGSVEAAPYFARGMGGNRTILFDRQNSIYLNATIYTTGSHTETYYNQLQIGPNQNNIYVQSQVTASNALNVKFLESGVLNSYEYATKWIEPNKNTKFLVNIDDVGNKYYLFFNNGSYANSQIPTPTNGTWLTGVNNDIGTTLVKYSSTGTKLWATYTPTIFGLQTDKDGNVYISGSNTNQQNFTTPGVFQENFPANVSGYTGYIAKLNSQGQRVWVTYHPGYARVMRTFSEGLYFTFDTIPYNYPVSISSTGAYQTAISKIAIMKLNATNGTRDWSTFYGPNSNSYNINGLEINETGVYIMGTSSYNSTNYFATAGAYKPQITGSSDYFLSKFDVNGSRLWSTYFGSNKSEYSMAITPMALSGNDIYVCGTIYGDGENISTAGAYQTSPEQNTSSSHNLFFSKFYSDGSLVWTSYYGGTNSNSSQVVNIAYNNSSLYLYGNTNSSIGYTTLGCWQSQILDPLPNENNNTNFLARFDQNVLATAEINNLENNLILYDNPNDGKFIISGKFLEKENCSFILYDISGREIATYKMSKSNSQSFNLKNKLLKGNYILVVQDSKNKKIKSFNMMVN